MEAFESLIALLLRQEGYWTTSSFKVVLTPKDKRRIRRPTTPRWELDLVAYKGSTNEVLAIECKSFLDSTGVVFRNGCFEPEKRYKLFTDARLRGVVLRRLANQLLDTKACAPSPQVRLCLAAGHIADKSDRTGLARHFGTKGWLLFDEEWVREKLRKLAAPKSSYENDIAFLVSKILLR